MKRNLVLAGIFLIYSFGTLTFSLYQSRDAIGDLLTDTASFLRVTSAGTSAAPQNILRVDCAPGDQYYACSTYTVSGANVKVQLRVNVNGTPYYLRLYEGPQ